MRPSLFTAALAITASSLVACNDGTAGTPDDDYVIVPDGKEDSFRSPTALEFLAKADATVTLPESARTLSDADRLAQAQELVSAKLLQIGWFLNLYVADKEDEDANKSYGGFHAMARNSSVRSLKISAIHEVTYTFNFEATIAAQNKFLSLLPGTSATGGKMIDLAMGKISNEDLLAGNWQGRYDVHSWDPNKQAADAVEKQPMLVAAATSVSCTG